MDNWCIDSTIFLVDDDVSRHTVVLVALVDATYLGCFSIGDDVFPIIRHDEYEVACID